MILIYAMLLFFVFCCALSFIDLVKDQSPSKAGKAFLMVIIAAILIIIFMNIYPYLGYQQFM